MPTKVIKFAKKAVIEKCALTIYLNQKWFSVLLTDYN